MNIITLEDFKKLDIRIGKVISAERVPNSEKLIKLIFDVGGGEEQIVAGIAKVFPEPEVLIGKEMPLVLNLEPREMMGLKSEGMMLAVPINRDEPVLLHPAKAVPPGSVVR